MKRFVSTALVCALAFTTIRPVVPPKINIDRAMYKAVATEASHSVMSNYKPNVDIDAIIRNIKYPH